jgi:hypothetical protein
MYFAWFDDTTGGGITWFNMSTHATNTASYDNPYTV